MALRTGTLLVGEGPWLRKVLSKHAPEAPGRPLFQGLGALEEGLGNYFVSTGELVAVETFRHTGRAAWAPPRAA